jgi:hypothetical protein
MSKTIIENVAANGDMNDWREMLRNYSKNRILEVVERSNQLSDRDKKFTRLFIDSDFISPN